MCHLLLPPYLLDVEDTNITITKQRQHNRRHVLRSFSSRASTFLNIRHSFHCLSSIKFKKSEMISETSACKVTYSKRCFIFLLTVRISKEKPRFKSQLDIQLSDLTWVLFPSPNLAFSSLNPLTVNCPFPQGHGEGRVIRRRLRAATSRLSVLAASAMTSAKVTWTPWSGDYVKAPPLRID